MVAQGLEYLLDFEAYSGVDAINYSRLKHMKRSPLSYKWHLDNPQPPTPAMVLGSATHRVLLEPERVGDFAVWMNGRRQGKAWEAFCEDNAARFIITEAERAAMVGMAVAVRRNPIAAAYLKHGNSEVSMFWRDPATGRDFKGRLDRLTADDDGPLIIDVKTTRDVQPFRFGNEAHRLGYHIQFAMYQNGYHVINGELPRVKVIAVEQKPPHETAVFNVPADVLQQGHEDFMRLMKRVIECEAAGLWPAEMDYETDLTLPTWAYSDASFDDLSDLELITN